MSRSAPVRNRAPRAGAHERLEGWFTRERARRSLEAQGDLLDAVVERGGGRFGYAYTPGGDLVRIREADGTESSYEYDSGRRLVRAVHPDGSVSRYEYGDGGRLDRLEDRGISCRFHHDAAGRLVRIHRGSAPAAVFRYDAEGRVREARSGEVSTESTYDASGRTTVLRQIFRGVALQATFEYDAEGRLSALRLPGAVLALRYRWDRRGRPSEVLRGEKPLARFVHDDEAFESRVQFANGVGEVSKADPVDGRLLSKQVVRGTQVLLRREFAYDAALQILDDGDRRYRYDDLGRLVEASDRDGARREYAYDVMDNRIRSAGPDGARVYRTGRFGRLARVESEDGAEQERWVYDSSGRPERRRGGGAEWSYRFDDADRLAEVLRNGIPAAEFLYDHKGRLVFARQASGSERYFYGPGDELLAVTDELGRPLRAYVRTPLGPLAEVRGGLDDGEVLFLHHDGQGTCLLLTDGRGERVAGFRYGPFGEGVEAPAGARPQFKGRFWHSEIGLYWFGARWYDPETGRFLTRDTYTGGPDDERIVHPVHPAERQAALRDSILGDWLKRPRVRHPFAFCGNDPVNACDPTGHWSFGGVVLSLLGAIWTLPNTIFGLVVEITCLVGEVIRWIVWLVTAGNVSWATPGFDVAASGRLNAFALVFKGGWLGSFSGLLGITFGNVFFVYSDWETDPYASGSGTVSPAAYGGSVSFPKNEALYEHELRHTNQYGWFGPFFHLGLPIWGVYLWDVIINGYRGSWLETDAREHGGL